MLDRLDVLDVTPLDQDEANATDGGCLYHVIADMLSGGGIYDTRPEDCTDAGMQQRQR